MLVRKHIHQLLSSYYKQPHNAVVGSTQTDNFESNPINFKWLLGHWHWRRTYQQLYQQQTGQWLTPVELFRPYYSRVIGNFVANEAEKIIMNAKEEKEGQHNSIDNEECIEIVEIGGGRGTNALSILDHLQKNHSNIYDKLESYTILDSSPSLYGLMEDVLVNGSIDNQSNTNRHAHKINLKRVDMIDVAEKK
jgi:hypothetical protein